MAARCGTLCPWTRPCAGSKSPCRCTCRTVARSSGCRPRRRPWAACCRTARPLASRSGTPRSMYIWCRCPRARTPTWWISSGTPAFSSWSLPRSWTAATSPTRSERLYRPMGRPRGCPWASASNSASTARARTRWLMMESPGLRTSISSTSSASWRPSWSSSAASASPWRSRAWPRRVEPWNQRFGQVSSLTARSACCSCGCRIGWYGKLAETYRRSRRL
mmetsp:Transcript_55671/g.180692  ORF Transcript_55671/g.180692 Transcript_55671/m.180692 type:complete len:220 (-) Transcript_55671:6661-7320(-)